MHEFNKSLDLFISEENEFYKDIKWNGKGIVIPSGGTIYLFNALMNIRYIREELKSDIPIEIWYLGKKEIKKHLFTEIEKFKNIKFIDALETFKETDSPIRKVVPTKSIASINGWMLKIHSMIYSSFEEIIYLDSDCFLFQKPDLLFEIKEYKEKKAIFSADIDLNYKTSGRLVDPNTFIVKRLGIFNNRKWDYSKPNPLWDILQTKEDSLPEFESGFILVNKKYHSTPLLVTLFLNQNSDFTYQYVYGDKDTFHLAWAKCNSSCHMLKDVTRYNEHICSYYNNKILFEHRVFDTKFNPFLSLKEFPNNQKFNRKELFDSYFIFYKEFCYPKIFS